MMWADVHDKSRSIGIAVAFFAIGVWADGIWNGTAHFELIRHKAEMVSHLERITQQYRTKLVQRADEIKTAERENHELLRAISSAQDVQGVTITRSIARQSIPVVCPDRSDFIANEINQAYRLGLKDGAKN